MPINYKKDKYGVYGTSLHNEIVRNKMKLNKHLYHKEDLMNLSSMNESQKHDAEGREPDIKEHTLYGSLYIKFKSRENKSMMVEGGRRSAEGKVTERGYQGVSGMFLLLVLGAGYTVCEKALGVHIIAIHFSVESYSLFKQKVDF